MIETHKKGSLKNYWEDKPKTMSANIIFEEGSDWDIKTAAEAFLEELRDRTKYRELWEKRYAAELELIKYAMNPEGPMVWHHFRDYLDIAKKAGLNVGSRTLEAAVTHSESIHVARKAAEFKLDLRQMTFLLVRPETTTVYDVEDIKVMQIHAGNSMENINKAVNIAESIRSVRGKKAV